MPKGRGPDRGMALGQKYFAAGLRFAGGIIAFALGGFWLDGRLGTTPLFTVGGTLGGAVLSYLSIYRDVARDREADRQRKADREREGGT